MNQSTNKMENDWGKMMIDKKNRNIVLIAFAILVVILGILFMIDQKKKQAMRDHYLTSIYTTIDENFLDISEEKKNAAKDIFAQEDYAQVERTADRVFWYALILSDSEMTDYLIHDSLQTIGIKTTPEALLEIYFHLSPETQITQDDISASEYIYLYSGIEIQNFDNAQKTALEEEKKNLEEENKALKEKIEAQKTKQQSEG